MKKILLLCLIISAAPSLIAGKKKSSAPATRQAPDTTIITQRKLALRTLEEAQGFITALLKKLVSPGMVLQKEITESLDGFNKRIIEIIDADIVPEQKAALLAILDKGLAIEDDLNNLSTKVLRARLDELVTATTSSINKLRALLTPRLAALFEPKIK